MKFERPDIVRPPSEWRSYFLPLTSGCSNNTCTFCNRWGEKLQMRELEDIKKEIDALALYIKSGLTLPEMPRIVYAVAQEWDGRGLFLLDSDALVYPFPKLKEALEYLNSEITADRKGGCLRHRPGHLAPHRRGIASAQATQARHPLHRAGKRR
jgi:hypothetical protein